MAYSTLNIKVDGSDVTDFLIDRWGTSNEVRAKMEGDNYVKEVRRLLFQISLKDTGKALLRAISRWGHKVMTIKPEENGDGSNAKAVEDSDIHAAKKGKSVVGRRVDLIGDKGTGFGSDTTVYFTPNSIKRALGFKTEPGFLSDQILVHELTHGLRDMAGINFRKPVPFQKFLFKDDENNRFKKDHGYTNMEEWFAVLIENIYRSECGKTLRVGYTSHFGNYTEKQFIQLGMNRSHMRQFRREHRELFSDLREIPEYRVPFNPTRLVMDI